nr:hypothetical protein [Marinicella sp. W31]MDC2875907.1 hypothetical protein [Marinicella sp. W31]
MFLVKFQDVLYFDRFPLFCWDWVGKRSNGKAGFGSVRGGFSGVAAGAVPPFCGAGKPNGSRLKTDLSTRDIPEIAYVFENVYQRHR